MQGINETLDAIAAADAWRQLHQRVVQSPPSVLLDGSINQEYVAVDEIFAKHQLAGAGIPIPQSTVCGPRQAPAAACQLGLPVAVKMVHEKLLHKTEAGAVVLNINSRRKVADAIAQMQKNVALRQPDAASNRFLIERMQDAPLAELIIGVRQDAQFGLAMTIGSGGVLVELVGDSVTLLLPSSRDDIIEAIEGLRVSRLLNGFRGTAKVDMKKLADELTKVTDFMIFNRGSVAELEINPMFVYEDSICAVDALMHTRAAA